MIRQSDKVLAVMLPGKPVTKEQFQKVVGSEVFLYRLPTYMWNLRERFGAKIKPIKEGREVTAYQLTNASAFRSAEFKALMNDPMIQSVVAAAKKLPGETRGRGRPKKARRGRPPGSKNKTH